MGNQNLTRRDFLQAAGFGIATSILGPVWANSSGKRRRKPKENVGENRISWSSSPTIRPTALSDTTIQRSKHRRWTLWRLKE